MRLLSFLFAIICLGAHPAQTQQLSEENELYVQSLLDSAELLKLKNPNRSLALALQVLEWLPEVGYEKTKAFAYIKAANAEKMNSHREAALDYIHQAMKLSESIQDTSLLMKCHFMTGTIYGFYDESDSALVHYQRTIDLYIPGDDVFYPANAYTNLGSIMKGLGQEDKAEAYYLKGYEISRSNNYSWIFTLSRLMSYYASRQDPRYFNYLDTFSNSDFVRNGSEAMVAAHFYSILNLTHASPQEKENKLREIFVLAGKQSGPIHQVELGLKLNDVLIEQRKYPASQALLESLLVLARQSNNGRAEADVNHALYETARAMRRPENALAYLERFSFIMDSLHTVQMQQQIQELNVRFDVVQKDNEIEQQRLKLEQERRNRNYLMLVSALLVMIAGITWFYFRNRIRTARRLRQQEEIIHTQEKEKLRQEKELSKLAASLESQEKERNRIARDLHDGVGSLMSGISAQVENLMAQQPGNALYAPLKQMVKDTAAELRRTSYDLMPAGLLRMGLEPALRDLCMNLIVKNGIEPTVEFQADLTRLNADQQLIVYRVVQELFHNIIKHAKASHVLLQLSMFEDQLTLIIEDDGRGFSVEEKTLNGIGLGSIRSRVDLLSGFLDISSVPGEGTTVTINFPLSLTDPLKAV